LSKIDELLRNVFEYKNLLGFLNKNYPEVLLEWSVGAEQTPEANTNTDTFTAQPRVIKDNGN
jgi:hypothetical protein